MKKTLIILISILISMSVHANCSVASIPAQVGVQTVMNHIVQISDVMQIGNELGKLRIGILPEKFLSETVNAHSIELVVRISYAHLRDQVGPKTTIFKYILESNFDCSGFEIKSVVRSGLSLPTFGNKVDSKVMQIALQDLTSTSSFVPLNRHSGSNSLIAFVPKRCADQKTASITIQRLHHGSGGIIQRGYGYLVDIDTQKILVKQERAGEFLSNICK